MSDFQWKDMSSEKWYIIYTNGHEGPYSLNYLKTKLTENKVNLQLRIWSEGLPSEITLEAALNLAREVKPEVKSKVKAVAKREIKPEIKKVPKKELIEEVPPPLPPLPIEEAPEVAPTKEANVESSPVEEVPPLPPLPEDTHHDAGESQDKVVPPSSPESRYHKRRRGAILLVLFLLTSIFAGVFHYLKEKNKEMSFVRPQGMSLKVADRINDYLQFKGWNEPLFFKEFISEDYSHLWLATSSFQSCSVKANFKSIKDKLLTLNDEEIEFEGKAKLEKHLVEFSKMNFISGRKVIPGMYEMNVTASDCQWNGLIPLAMNFFKAPEKTYESKMTVILYPQGADEFKDLLERVLRKKLDKAVEEQNQIELFWLGIQEKLQTLLAVSLQIEQLLLDFIAKDARKFHANLPIMVSDYTKKYGQFLTNFVVANQESFKQASLNNIKGVSVRRNYEVEISEAARRIGYTSMKLIEDLQKLKNPRRVQLSDYEKRVKEEFAQLKKSINQKIIQVSDDRSLSPDEAQEEDSPSQE